MFRCLCWLATTVDNTPTIHITRRLHEITVLVAWSRDDRAFPPEHAQRLHDALPASTLAWCDNAYAYLPIDQPDWLAETISTWHANAQLRAAAP